MRQILEAQNVSKQLLGEVSVTLVQDVTLSVREGEFVVITGPSGSGKSSLLYILGLLDVPSRGRVFVNGVDTSDLDDNALSDMRLREIGFIFQFHFLLPEFSALENIMIPMQRLAHLSPPECKKKALQLLAALGLKDQAQKRPRQLSGGQSQRVALARALANDPPLILADEPTGNLDSVSSSIVRTLLHDLSKQHQRSVIVVTHDPLFSELADRQITLIDGKLQQ